MVVVTKHVRVVLFGLVTLVTAHIGTEVLSGTPLLIEAGVVILVAIETGLSLLAQLGRQVGLKSDGRSGCQPERKEYQRDSHGLSSPRTWIRQRKVGSLMWGMTHPKNRILEDPT
jgi:hypothetical protein